MDKNWREITWDLSLPNQHAKPCQKPWMYQVLQQKFRCLEVHLSWAIFIKLEEGFLACLTNFRQVMASYVVFCENLMFPYSFKGSNDPFITYFAKML